MVDVTCGSEAVRIDVTFEFVAVVVDVTGLF